MGCDDSSGGSSTTTMGGNSVVVDSRAGGNLGNADKLEELSASSPRRVRFVGLSSVR